MGRRAERGGQSPFLRAVAAALFLALCAYVGAALYRRLSPAEKRLYPAAAPAPPMLEGIAVRQEQLLTEDPGVPSGTRLSARETGENGPGVFMAETDGFEALGPGDLEELDPEGLEALLRQRPRPDRNARGKLIRGYAWYYAALTETPAELSPGPCALRFEAPARTVPARLLRICPEEGRTLLLFRLSDGDEELYRLRICRASLLTERER